MFFASSENKTSNRNTPGWNSGGVVWCAGAVERWSVGAFRRRAAHTVQPGVPSGTCTPILILPRVSTCHINVGSPGWVPLYCIPQIIIVFHLKLITRQHSTVLFNYECRRGLHARILHAWLMHTSPNNAPLAHQYFWNFFAFRFYSLPAFIKLRKPVRRWER